MVEDLIKIIREHKVPIVIPVTPALTETLNNSSNDSYKGKDRVDLTNIGYSIGTYINNFVLNTFELSIRLWYIEDVKSEEPEEAE